MGNSVIERLLPLFTYAANNFKETQARIQSNNNLQPHKTYWLSLNKQSYTEPFTFRHAAYRNSRRQTLTRFN